jgi:hypothetical protein
MNHFRPWSVFLREIVMAPLKTTRVEMINIFLMLGRPEHLFRALFIQLTLVR